MSQSNGAAAVFSKRTRVTLSDLTMKKRTITETLLEECPNCGAARLDRETTCRFCDTALVQVKRTTVIAPKKPYEDTKLGAGPDLSIDVSGDPAYQPLIEPYHKYRKIMKYGTEYEATVIGVLSGVAKKPDQWVISDNGSSYSLKVTAQINGRETDVILRLPADTPVQECPVGSRIKIKGITDKENGKEYNDFVLV